MLAVVVWLLLAAAVAAGWQTAGHAVNILTTPGFRTVITEEYDPPERVFPSEQITKKVYVKNTGSQDAVVRIRLEKQFGVLGEDGVFREEESLDPGLIRIHFDDTGTWIFNGGYYYYTDVLKPGQTTREPLMKSFTLEQTMSNLYQGYAGRIEVFMESVQAESNGVEIWGLTAKDLGIAYEKMVKDSMTEVVFDSPENGFIFQAENTDLFASFKNLMPGCMRTQTIRIRNQSNQPVRIRLRAENAEQDTMNQEQKELVGKLLTEYAQVEITEEGNALYKGSVDGNLSGKKGEEGMGSWILLGKYAPGEEKDLTVSLSVSPEMDNSFSKLLGKVKWVFQAEDTYSDYPYTGDSSKTGIWMAFMMVCAVCIAVSLFIFRRRRKCGSR